MQASTFSRKQQFNLGFLAGLIAGVIASAFMILLSLTINGLSLPEVFGSFFTQVLPPTAFDYLHRTIGGDAKHYLFYGILVGQCLVFALCGGLCTLATRSAAFARAMDVQGQLHWSVGVILALILWLLTGLLLLPLTGAGIFAANLDNGMLNSMVSLAIVGLIFGLAFVYLQNSLAMQKLQKQGTKLDSRLVQANLSRRSVLSTGLLALGFTTLGVVALRFITSVGNPSSALSLPGLKQQYKSKISPPPTPNYGPLQPVSGLSEEVTPNDKYYVVSKNLLSDPTVNGNTWKMMIGGEVNQTYSLTYDELMALPMKKQYESMMCISNEVGGEYMSNALWEGIPLADLLQKAGGVKSGATKVVLYAADDYSDSIHLSKALEGTTLVAVRMNGATLPTGHGYPARLLVPGIYGMKHVKWITRIEVVKQDYQGYWQTRGWSDPAPIRLTSRIDTPAPMATIAAGKPSYIAGVAFSGNKGISEVDVSVDAGKSWQRALLKRPLSDLTWVLWELPWTPTAGSHTIVVRAVDIAGNVQDPDMAPPLPDGSSGYHSITISAT